VQESQIMELWIENMVLEALEGKIVFSEGSRGYLWNF
jgi:hypothetical protein